MSSIMITKADGTKELFNKEKFVASLSRAGANSKIINDILPHIEREIIDGTTTHQIYKHAFSLLHQKERPSAARYSLRRALLELGPTGFPFEAYIAELFRARGFETKVRQLLLGRCVEHELDIVAWNNERLLMVESKFHNHLGEKTDLKVALYVKARFDDLSEQLFDFGRKRPLDEGWLVTNTKFTSHAIQYAECAHVKLLGWNYPSKGNLQDLIVDYGMHPITCLETLSHTERTALLSKDVVLCRDIVSRKGGVEGILGGNGRLKEIEDEAKAVCGLT